MRNMTTHTQPPVPAPGSPPPSEPNKVKQVPKWVTGCVISIFVIGTGLLIYRQWYSEPATGEEIELKDGEIVPRSPGALARRFVPPAEGVRYNRNRDAANVRGGDVEMRVTLKRDGAKFNAYYAAPVYMTEEQRELVLAASRLAMDASAAKYVGVSAEQRKTLRGLPSSTSNMPIELQDGDTQKLQSLWNAYASARNDEAQSAAQDAIVNALKEIGEANLQKTKASVEARCDKISTILSAAQIEKFKTMGQPQTKKENLAKLDAKG
jgi:hypothetical protein